MDASSSFLSASRRCSRNQSPCTIHVSPMHTVFIKCIFYAIDDVNISRGACKTISSFNRSFRSRNFIPVVNERTSFAPLCLTMFRVFLAGMFTKSFEVNYCLIDCISYRHYKDCSENYCNLFQLKTHQGT